MEIIKKKGIKRINIEHNKPLFFIILLLLVFLVFLLVQSRNLSVQNNENQEINESQSEIGVGSSIPQLPVDSDDQTDCKTDSDCVIVQTSCCPCEMGGQEVCVSESNQYLFEEKLELCNEDLYCPAVYNCLINSCICNNGKCEANN